MEAPKPISLITPSKSENNLSFIDKKEFKLSNEKVEYIVEIGKLSSTENLGIKLKENISSTKVYYSNIFNLEELRNIHKSFRMFDNINEAISNIQDIFEEKKVNLKIENDNIFLILKNNKIGRGEDLISIKLNKTSLSLEELNENLFKEVSQLKNKIEDLENNETVVKLKNEIDKLKNEIISLKEENKKRDLKINELLNKIEKKEKLEKSDINKIDSKIITSKEELDFIINRLKQIDYFKNKSLSYELVFRGTRDGRTSNIFHQKCDGTPKTITIIKTIKGLKFGGYIEREWKSSGDWISDDENCFIFSLDLHKIYNPVKGKEKYCFYKNNGPNFSEFGLKDDLFNIKSSLNIKKKDIANKYFTYFDKDYEINGGEPEFQTEELEVFKII